MGAAGSLSATTRVAGVIGHPVRHSLSPALHNAAFAARGLDWAYLAFDVAPGDGEAAVRACRTLGIAGVSVTMPHKDAAARAVDELTPRAATLGAVNCVVRRGDRLVGDNTDGPGFLDALVEATGFVADGARTVVIGAGGAARAVILALAQAGADVAVVNRNPDNARVAASLAGGSGRVAAVAEVAAADLVVNATPIGMVTAESPEPDRSPVPADLLAPGQVVVDLVYHPARTRLLRDAADRGATAVGGLGMLVHQAGHAFRNWTGEEPPLEAMWAAARDGIRP